MRKAIELATGTLYLHGFRSRHYKDSVSVGESFGTLRIKTTGTMTRTEDAIADTIADA